MARPVGSLVTTVVPLALAACSYAGLLRPSVLKQVTAPVAGVTTIIAAPTSYAFEATPIVVDGVMFVSGFDSYVWALDATSGRLLWSYHHAVPLDTPLCCGNVNRGVAVATGRVYLGAANGHLVALDATTGREVWDVPFADVRSGERATAAPLVVKGLVIVGSSGGEYGTRGHIDAFDLETGARAWRRYTIPKPGEPGSESWEDADKTAWQRGGGAAWITGTYVPRSTCCTGARRTRDPSSTAHHDPAPICSPIRCSRSIPTTAHPLALSVDAARRLGL